MIVSGRSDHIHHRTNNGVECIAINVLEENTCRGTKIGHISGKEIH